jgi:hypothetical protein
MTISYYILLAILIPLCFAVVVGFSTWTSTQAYEKYCALRHDYRAAVGLPAMIAPKVESQPKFPWWLKYYFGYHLINHGLRSIAPTLCLTVNVILFSGVGLWFFKKAWAAYSVLREHPAVEPRLRRVPMTEIVGWSAAGLLMMGLVYGFIIIEGPRVLLARNQ